ncbi:MAG: hypothetical protein KatS3mg067_0825 [Thermosynechococcus sp.]|uniref:DUF2752 domain-containing protein n=1 Tax=Thermosynechococcus sp. TaxID=2814275 RepID=UPI002205FF25|nr:DUF2752 domain-containing protein [Thermosynechococcus sp.]BCX11887.1 MAG: hypothetical protein KatS3mg067_0825 [Thermosynechococcus sp.]
MLRFSDAVLSKQERLSRWGFLGLTTAPLVGAALFNHTGTPPFLLCPFWATTGIPCPGCGLTRSFMAIARGNLADALRMHLFGPILFLAFTVAAVLMALELKAGRRLQHTPFRYINERIQNWWWLGGIYLGYYGLRLYSLFHTGEFYINPLEILIIKIL